MFPVIAIEQALLNTANGDDFQTCIEELMKSYYKHDINLSDLNRHLLLLPDIIKKQPPQVKKVTSINTICEALNT